MAPSGTFINMTKIHGRPAAHVRKVARQAAVRLLGACAATAALAIGSLYCLLAGSDTLTRAAAITGAACAVYAVYQAEKSRIALARANAGLQAEKVVGRVLEKIGADHVIHGAIVGGGGDCDHLLLGPWAAAVETKSGKGRVSTREGKLTVGNRTLPRDAIGQARRQAAAASRQIGSTVHPIVCVVDAENVITYEGVIVCGRSHLKNIITGLPRSFNTGASNAHAERIARNTDKHQI